MPENLSWTSIVPQLSNLALTWGMRLLGAIALLIASWLISRQLAAAVTRALERTHIEPSVRTFAQSGTRAAVMVLGALLCLGVFGVEMTSVAALIGGAGVAVGLALKGNLANVASGLVVLAVQPFRVGDRVEIDGHAGTVTAIELLTTRIKSYDGAEVIVPNQRLLEAAMINHDRYDLRRAEVAVGVSYDADLDQAIATLTAVGDAHAAKVDKEETSVRVTGFGASSVDLALRVWVARDDLFTSNSQLHVEVKRALDRADIQIPFPQRDLHLVNLPTAMSAAA
jgi:small conductance mechanosensitive channel